MFGAAIPAFSYGFLEVFFLSSSVADLVFTASFQGIYDSSIAVSDNFRLGQHLANENQWLIANKSTLNQSKTEFMLIRSRQRLCTFQSAATVSL